jgi:hypothetical protein
VTVPAIDAPVCAEEGRIVTTKNKPKNTALKSFEEFTIFPGFGSTSKTKRPTATQVGQRRGDGEKR